MINPERDLKSDRDPLVELAKTTFLTRKLRSEIFDSALFGEPAWDILLVLFARDPDNVRCSVRDLAREIELGEGTVSRWLKILAMRDLLHFEADQAEITPKGRQSMRQYLRRQVASLMGMLAAVRSGG